MESALLIVNRNAGRKGTRRDASRAAAHLQQRGIRVRLAATSSVEEARLEVRNASEDVVVAVGGDGTLRGVVREAWEEKRICGLIPRGTANVVARELGIPLDPIRAADLLVDGEPRVMDIGLINEEIPFLAMVGIGIDARIVHGVGPGRFKVFRYGLKTMGCIARPRLTPLKVSVDGIPLETTVYQALVTNTANYGGWFSLCNQAQPDDGRFDWLTMQRKDRRSILRLSLSGITHRPLSTKWARYGQGRRFTIDTANGTPIPVQADGDACGNTPLSIEIIASALRIIAPKKGSS